MNPTQPMTRRDVFALVTYASLGYNVITWILLSVDQLVLTRIALFKSPGITYGNNWPGVISVAVLSLACLPFVTTIANAAGGRRSTHLIEKHDVFSVVLSCVGLMLFLTSFPQIVSTGYSFWQASSISSRITPSTNSFYLRYLASTTIRLSLGFAFAFFPAIFDSMRHRVNDETSS